MFIFGKVYYFKRSQEYEYINTDQDKSPKVLCVVCIITLNIVMENAKYVLQMKRLQDITNKDTAYYKWRHEVLQMKRFYKEQHTKDEKKKDHNCNF